MLKSSATLALKAILAAVAAAIAMHKSMAATAPNDPGYDHNGTIWDRLIPPLAGAKRGGAFTAGGGNNLKQFSKALAAGLDIIEMDLRPTKDGHVVVFDDEKLDRATWGCKGLIRDKTLSEIRKCKLVLTNREIPTFAEALESIHGRAVVNAEFREAQTIQPAINEVRVLAAFDWVYFNAGGSREVYDAAREYDARVALQFHPANADDLDWLLAKDDSLLVAIELNDTTWTAENIERIRGEGKLTTYNAWNMVWHQELGGAACDEVWAKGVDIAISNRTHDCVKQKP